MAKPPAKPPIGGHPKKRLRQRPLYWQPAGEWVGFGADLNTHPDLFESVYRFAWWRVAVCRVCLITVIKNASAILDQAEALLTQQRKRIGK
jgi:hypothetical protein